MMNSQFWPFPAGSLMIGCMAFVDPAAEPKPCMEEVELARFVFDLKFKL
jgi:NADH pyrophosphatase NudC (nudix superfamily)